jgi:3-deoxy-D-manno-octulosonate 8-phosphate phosphatase (KDO 8-P phosphatase)
LPSEPVKCPRIFFFGRQARKLDAYHECVQIAGVRADEVAYKGDDLPDMPLLERAGLAVAVANAAPEVREVSHYVTKREVAKVRREK